MLGLDSSACNGRVGSSPTNGTNLEVCMNINTLIPSALTIEQCEKLPTKRLLTYYKKHRSQLFQSMYDNCVCDGNNNVCEVCTNIKPYFEKIKAILNTREHVGHIE